MAVAIPAVKGVSSAVHNKSTVIRDSGVSSSRSSGVSSSDPLSKYMTMLDDISAKNSARSAEQAQIQRDWQVAQNAKAMEFSASEAAKSRDWQKLMSDTAHQREIKDLQAAGLNPVLSAMGGNGAAVTSGAAASGVTSSGAMGDTDMSQNSALVSIIGKMLDAQTALANQATSAAANLAVADKYTQMSKLTSQIAAQAQLDSASISAAAHRYASDVGADASKVAAAIHAAAQRYGYDVGSMTQLEIAKFNAQVNRELQANQFAHEFNIREAYPTTEIGALMSLLGQFTGDDGMSGVVSGLKAFLFGSGGSGFGGRNGGTRGSGAQSQTKRPFMMGVKG